MAFLGELGSYTYLVDNNGDIWSPDGKTYYGNMKSTPGLTPVKSSSSSVSGLGGLGDQYTTASARRQGRAMAAAATAAAGAALLPSNPVNRVAFYKKYVNDIIASLPAPQGKWYITHNEQYGLTDPYILALLKTGTAYSTMPQLVIFDDSGMDAYPPYPYLLPPKHQWVPPGKAYAKTGFTGTIDIKSGGATVTQTFTYPITYQTGWGQWRTRQALHGWGLVEHTIAYALPAIAIVALPFVLPAALAVGGATGVVAAPVAVAAPVVTGGAAAGGAVATGGIWSTITGAVASILPSAGTLETVASAGGTALSVGEKVVQAGAAKKQAAQQAAQLQQQAAVTEQATKAQVVAQEIQDTVNAGQPITQDLVNRAAAVGIKLSPTGVMTKITEAGMFGMPSLTSKNLVYLGIGAAALIVLYTFTEKPAKR